jgi:hypothetical protein
MKLPQEIINDVECESDGIGHGVIYLELHYRDDNIHFYKLNREKSIVTLKKSVGVSSPTKSYSADKKKMSAGMNK